MAAPSFCAAEFQAAAPPLSHSVARTGKFRECVNSPFTTPATCESCGSELSPARRRAIVALKLRAICLECASEAAPLVASDSDADGEWAPIPKDKRICFDIARKRTLCFRGSSVEFSER